MKRALSALLTALVVTSFASSADARPSHKRHHHVERSHSVKHHARHHYRRHKVRHVRNVQQPVQQQTFFEGFQGGFESGFNNGSSLVAKARNYIGATARQVGVRTSLWCSAFIRKLAPNATGVDDRALSWERRGHRIAPQVGAIVTMNRGKRGGHVGVVSGFTKSGDPIVISGNHGNRVAESVYPRSRIRGWYSAS